MQQPEHLPVDADLKKGAVERTLDRSNTPARDEQGRPKKAIETTRDVRNADPKDVAHAEKVLGADDGGTPG